MCILDNEERPHVAILHLMARCFFSSWCYCRMYLMLPIHTLYVSRFVNTHSHNFDLELPEIHPTDLAIRNMPTHKKTIFSCLMEICFSYVCFPEGKVGFRSFVPQLHPFPVVIRSNVHVQTCLRTNFFHSGPQITEVNLNRSRMKLSSSWCQLL